MLELRRNGVSEEPEDERGEAEDAVSLFITVHERWMTVVVIKSLAGRK